MLLNSTQVNIINPQISSLNVSLASILFRQKLGEKLARSLLAFINTGLLDIFLQACHKKCEIELVENESDLELILKISTFPISNNCTRRNLQNLNIYNLEQLYSS